MRKLSGTIALVLVAAIVGCAQRPGAPGAPVNLEPPTSAELPRFNNLEPHTAVRVGVEGAMDRPRSDLAGDFSEPPLTDEELAATASATKALEETYDPLKLYRPPNNLVYPFDAGGRIGSSGAVYQPYGRYQGYSTPHAGVGLVAELPKQSYPLATKSPGVSGVLIPPTGVGPESWLRVYYGPPTVRAARRQIHD